MLIHNNESSDVCPLCGSSKIVNIGDLDYGFGTFISGPSKTADIEQSLVLGAHGPKSMTVFLVEDTPD